MEEILLSDIIDAVDGKVYKYSSVSECIITDVSTDTRKIKENSLFIALKGEVFDGHNYIEQAFSKGAKCVISEKKIKTEIGTVILVNDTKVALKKLAEYYRSLFNIPAIAITGSVGKTTTKDLVYSVLSEKFNVLKTEGNFNNEIGVPLTIFNINSSHDVLVIEMGMSDFGEIHNLSKIVKPDVAVITNIGEGHIENLGDRNGVFRAKIEIIDSLKKNGILILNNDDDILCKYDNNGINLIKIGEEENSNYRAFDVRENGLKGIDFKVSNGDDISNISLNMPGRHMVTNGLIAYVCGKYLNLSDAEIMNGFKKAKPSNMRMEILTSKKGFKIINDVYNANPTSMKASINVLNKSNVKGRKIAILGDMLELGENEHLYHYELGKYIIDKNIDILVTTGSLGHEIYKGAIDGKTNENQLIFYAEMQEDIKDVISNINLLEDDVVLVKGSRGMKLEKTVDIIKE